MRERHRVDSERPARRVGEVALPLGAQAEVLALQRTVGNRATRALLRQANPQGHPGAGPSVPASQRRRLVFIMGRDRNGFYSLAERYWRVHEPGATFVTSARSLADIIDWMNANVTDPVGLIYIVSHANEDGTLSFGVDSSDQDHHMSYGELRDALGASGSLPKLQHNQADNAIVHIKGCDIGRTPAMLDLIGKAFGGHVAVYAPTHEQVYGYDPWIADQARRQTESLIHSDAERHHPMPPPVDPRLTGAARVAAVRERERLMAARRRAIDAEARGRHGEVTREMEAQGVYEALSGPEVQQPGTARIPEAQVRAEINYLYPHLSAAQRNALVRDLVRGESVQTIRPMTYTLAVPSSLAHVAAFWGASLAESHFRATQLVSVKRTTQGDKAVVTVEVEGRFNPPGGPSTSGTMTLTSETPSDALIIKEGRERTGNAERYAWDLEETPGRPGFVNRAARGRRMRGYLHHQSLDASAHEHFQIEAGNLDYFGTNGLPPRAMVKAP